MTSSRRIRNVAFLALLVTLVWAGSVTLRADSGGFFCAMGDCMLLYDNCEGSWDYYEPPHENAPPCSGCCTIKLTNNTGCSVQLYDEWIYRWAEDPQGSTTFFYCYQFDPEG